jgi:small subunit ribosomal protein S19e
MSKVYTLKDVSSHEFVVEYAQHLKKTGKMDVPKWIDIAKTAPFKELAPYDEDYYYIRAASIARKIYLRQGTGVGAFRKVYGGRKNRGTKKEHFQKASGGLIRSILKNLESMGVVEKCTTAKGCVAISGRHAAIDQPDSHAISVRLLKYCCELQWPENYVKGTEGLGFDRNHNQPTHGMSVTE